MKVLYVTSNGGIHDYRFLKKLVPDYEVLLLHYASGNLIEEIKNIEGLKIISRRPLIRSFPLLSEYFHFKKIYNSFKPDIVHSGYVWQVGILAALANVHPHLSMPWGSDILFEPDKSRIIKTLVRKVMRQCDQIQCDAEFVKSKMIKDYSVPADIITVFPWGIDLGLFGPADKNTCRKQLNIEKDKFVVIFSRWLRPIYGITDLLEGYKIFSKGKDDVLLYMVTEGFLKDDVINFINRNNLEQKIKLVPPVPNNRLPGILSATDVYISPSISDGTSLSLLEAMATGLGLILTDVPAIKEWVSDKNGILVQRNNPQQIADALEKYYINRELIANHGDVNIKVAQERADWDKNYLMLKEIYKKLTPQA